MSSAPLNVLMISVRADYGGGPEHVFRLMESLGSRVNLFAAIPEDVPYYERISGLIRKEKILIIPHRRFSLFYLLKIIFYILKKNITIVHSHGKGAGVYSRPAAFFTLSYCIHSFHGVHTEKYSSLGRVLYSAYERLLSLVTHHFIATGDGERNEAIKAWLAPMRKITLIHNGVAVPRVRTKYPSDGVFTILTITRFDEAKNPALIVEVMSSLKNHHPEKQFRLIVVGDGEGREITETDIALAGLREITEFTGVIDNVSDVYLRSFCYLSTSKMEGLPLSVLEAMSFGLPCVVTDVPGNNDLIKPGENGFLYALNDPSQAAQDIIRLMTDENLWHIYSRNAAEMIIHNYSTEQMSDKVLALYHKTTGSTH